MKIRYWSFGAYFFITLFAIAFDLFDGSGGAKSLATLPIAFIAMVNFLVGPFLSEELRKITFRCWLVGELLVLVGFICIGFYGEAALKDGGTIFAYAMLTLTPPASIVLPFTYVFLDNFFSNSGFGLLAVTIRTLTVWSACVIAAIFQWKLVCWLVDLKRLKFSR